MVDRMWCFTGFNRITFVLFKSSAKQPKYIMGNEPSLFLFIKYGSIIAFRNNQAVS